MATLKKYHLQDVLIRLLSNSYSDHDLLAFIDLSEKIAVGYLRFLQFSGKKIAPSNAFESSELSNVAIDCIAPIFRRNEALEFIELKRFFSRHFDHGKVPDDLVLFVELKRLVIQSVKQGLAILFRERDPEGARLLRNIRGAIQKSDDIILFENLSQVYVFSPVNLNDPDLFRKFVRREVDIHHPLVREKLRRDLPLIPIDDLKNDFLANYSPYLQIPALIRNLLKLVSEKKTFANYLTVDEIVDVVKEFKRREVSLEDIPDQILTDETPENSYEARQFDHIMAQMPRRISELIKWKYGTNRKFPPEVLSAFQKALMSFSENYMNGKKKVSHFHLLKTYLPDLTFQDYRKTYRNAFEYLIKNLRREMKEDVVNIL
ncbi:MAG: hypothetical protein GXO76_10290 [Calditrichaeota bacterium]|nr:hypothetical protein [Calditrichota bacterium]